MIRNNKASCATIVLVAVLIAMLSACQPVEHASAPRVDDALQAMTMRTRTIRTLRGEARMSYQRPDQAPIKATMRLMGQNDGAIRLDAVTPLDTTLMTLVARNGEFALVDAQNNRHYYGAATPCNIARVLRVPMAPEQAFSILVGATPLIEHHSHTITWDENRQRDVLTLLGPTFQQVVRLIRTRQHWDLELSQISNLKNEVLLRIQPTGYRVIDGQRVPERIRVFESSTRTTLEIEFRREEINLTLPEAAFELPPANGLPSEHVSCSDQPETSSNYK